MSWHTWYMEPKTLIEPVKQFLAKSLQTIIEGRFHGIRIANLDHSISCSFHHVHTSQRGPCVGTCDLGDVK